METKTIDGIEVMAAGIWSNGRDRDIHVTRDHLDLAIARFNARPEGETVAIKLGHSSPGWNAKVADALGVPPIVLVGEGRDTTPTGLTEGMGRLGTITELKRVEDSVYAKAEAVPAPLADMIDGGMYTGVSPEAMFGFDSKGQLNNLALAGVAFLGEQDPAIAEMRPLSETTMFARFSHVPATLTPTSTSAPVVDKPTGGRSIIESGKRFWGAFSARRSTKPATDDTDPNPDSDGGQEMTDQMKKIAEALGIDTEDEEAVLKAVSDLKAKADADQAAADAAVADPAPADDPATADTPTDPTDHPTALIPTEMAAAFAKVVEEANAPLMAEIKALKEEREAAKQEDRAAYFARVASNWESIPGTPTEFGKKLAEVESTLGEDAVNKMVSFYTQQHELRATGSLIRPIGTSLIPAGSADDPFEATLKAYMETNSVDRPNALRHFATSPNMEEQRAFASYQKRNIPGA